MQVRVTCLRQLVSIEDAYEVTIPFNPWAGSTLKLCFRQLGFDEKIPDAEIDLGALDMICDERDAWLATELKALGRFGAKQYPQATARRKRLRVTEDVHQERIGTRSGIQLTSFSVMTWKIAPRGAVKLAQPAIPFRFAADAFVRHGVKISMSGVGGFAEYDGRRVSDRAFMRQPLGCGPGERTCTEFLTQLPGVAQCGVCLSKTEL
jgi:hypothetical protein